MKISLKSFTATILIMSMTALPLLSCSNGGSKNDRTEVSANQLYYDSLASNNYTSHSAAQPPEDLFVAVKHFDLVATGNTATVASAGLAPYVVYQPASVTSRPARAHASAIASALPGEGIPSFKAPDAIPAECQGLADTALSDCFENADDQDINMKPAAAHASHFDSGALAVLFGAGFEATLVDKVIDSSLANIDAATRTQIAAQLIDYINDAPAHSSLDLSQHNIFDRSGYALVGATLTDDSRGDVDADGDLEQHSTLILQISKTIDYTRSGHSQLDTILNQYHGFLPTETYQINLSVNIHLKSLQSLRQEAASSIGDPENPPTVEEELAQIHREWEATSINHALDANILKKIVEHQDLISWDNSEYLLSFQVAPDNVTEHLVPVLTAAIEQGDAVAYNLVEQHINAQTAIITGGSTAAPATTTKGAAPNIQVFYQVSRPRVGKAAGITTGWDYAMLDAAGNRVAILDPASGALMLAEEPSKLPLDDPSTAQSAWTKSGACKDDKSDWAYWPSRARTGNFGRGINWIFTESFLHNQVGDYKNIHWYQSVWKASAQVAIKGGMWVVKNYLKTQFAGADIPPKKSDYALYFIMEVLMPYAAAYTSNSSGSSGKSFTIAGYNYTIPKVIPDFWRKASTSPKSESFAKKVGNHALSFLIDHITDGVGQSLDVTITGWQDYSDGSHYGCFAFSYD